MPVRPKGNSWQVDVTVNGVRAPRVVLPTKVEALAVEAQFRADMLAGRAPEVRKLEVAEARVSGTLMDMLTVAVRRRWSGTKAERTSYTNAHFWLDALGAEFPISKLTPTHVDRVLEGWAALGTSNATLNRRLAALSVMINEAIDAGHLPRRFKLPRRREYEGRLRWLSDEEETHLLAHFAGDELMHGACMLALDTGFRAGEIWRLQIGDVNLGATPPTVTSWENKGDKPRTIPLTKRSTAMLRRLIGDRHRTELVFRGQINSYITSRKLILWRTAAGLPAGDDVVFHTLRHTCCSRLVQRGVPILMVQKWMGHSDINTTLRYAHLAPDSLAVGLTALEKEV